MVKPGKAAKKAKQLTKGHVVTKLEKKARPSNRKGKLSKRTETVRAVIRDVTGFAPYERKILELLQAGSSKDEKKALKVAKRRVGTHRRGMRKREYMRAVMQRLRHK